MKKYSNFYSIWSSIALSKIPLDLKSQKIISKFHHLGYHNQLINYSSIEVFKYVQMIKIQIQEHLLILFGVVFKPREVKLFWQLTLIEKKS